MGKQALGNYYPPVNFYFKVKFTGNASGKDNSFSEVSGIKATLVVEEVKEGGENRFSYRVPSRSKYENLVLKRGLMMANSPIMKWCQETIEQISPKIKPRDITVSLMDAEGNPLMDWNFKDAWPTQWGVADLNAHASKGEILVESIEFAYTYFSTEKKVITGPSGMVGDN